MKLGFLTACFPNLSLEEIVTFAEKAGFQALEVACWPRNGKDRAYGGTCHIDMNTLTDERAEAIQGLFHGSGLSISSLAYYPNNLHPDEETRTKIHHHLKRVIDAAHLLGVPLVGTFVGRDPWKDVAENLDLFKAVFPPLVSYASDRKVKLMIENCPMMYEWPGGSNVAYSPEIWDRMFEILPSPNFGLNFDPSHLLWQGIDHLSALRGFASRVFHVHAKDTEILPHVLGRVGIYGKGWWRYRLPGLGGADWRRFIAALHEMGYDGALSIEHEDPVWEGTPEKVRKGLLLGHRHLAEFLV